MNINSTVTLEKFIGKYLNYLNLFTLTKLTDLDIKVLKYFILLPEKFKYARFSLPAKKRVVELLKQEGIKCTPASVTNRLYTIQKKGFLRRDEDNVLYLKDFILNPIIEFIKNKTFTLNVVFSELETINSKDKTSFI